MYIPLKTTLYIINNDTCKDAYESLAYDKGGIVMVVDETVVCAGVPEAHHSRVFLDENGHNDACNVRCAYFYLEMCTYITKTF